MNLPRSSLPTRVPGAHLTQPVSAPEDGWFGPPVEWPAEDEDLKAKKAVARYYFEDSGLPDDELEAEDLLARVLDGVKRIG